MVKVRAPNTPWHGELATIIEVRPRLNLDGSIRYTNYTVKILATGREIYTDSFEVVS